MSLTVRDGTDVGLTGVGIYFIRTSTKRTLGCAAPEDFRSIFP